MTRNKKNKFKLKAKPQFKNVSPKMVRAIKRVQQELQRKENIEYGSRAQKVSFQFASDILARRMDK